jgi:membrane protein implicated in regulation of membrane protease activity
MTEPAEARVPPTPSIPLLLFAAIDLVLAFFLLLDGGFTIHFGVIAVIGLALAVLGLRGVRRVGPAEPPE